jgi:hypothetical protein
MNFTLHIISILIFFSNGLIAQKNYEREMSIEEVREDYEIFKNAIQAIHPNLYLYNTHSKSDSTLDRIEQLINIENNFHYSHLQK